MAVISVTIPSTEKTTTLCIDSHDHIVYSIFHMPKPTNRREIISINDSTLDVAMKLSQGNPGGVSVIIQLMQIQHDPDAFMGPLANLLSLDTHGIYGPNIWVLFKNCCAQRILNVVTVLRSVQLGLYSENEMWNCIDNCTPIDVEYLYNQVKKQLPNFNPQNEMIVM